MIGFFIIPILLFRLWCWKLIVRLTNHPPWLFRQILLQIHLIHVWGNQMEWLQQHLMETKKTLEDLLHRYRGIKHTDG